LKEASPAALDRARGVRLMIFDVDGVLTDGGIAYDNQGIERKQFHIRDGLLRDGKVQTLELDPICRLAGPNYAKLGSVVTMPSVRQTPKADTD
jgi:hypothetical protein